MTRARRSVIAVSGLSLVVCAGVIILRTLMSDGCGCCKALIVSAAFVFIWIPGQSVYMWATDA